jgi:hypothetical protein
MCQLTTSALLQLAFSIVAPLLSLFLASAASESQTAAVAAAAGGQV